MPALSVYPSSTAALNPRHFQGPTLATGSRSSEPPRGPCTTCKPPPCTSCVGLLRLHVYPACIAEHMPMCCLWECSSMLAPMCIPIQTPLRPPHPCATGPAHWQAPARPTMPAFFPGQSPAGHGCPFFTCYNVCAARRKGPTQGKVAPCNRFCRGDLLAREDACLQVPGAPKQPIQGSLTV